MSLKVKVYKGQNLISRLGKKILVFYKAIFWSNQFYRKKHKEEDKINCQIKDFIFIQ